MDDERNIDDDHDCKNYFTNDQLTSSMETVEINVTNIGRTESQNPSVIDNNYMVVMTMILRMMKVTIF